mmetsp:Transcript_39153/g.92461  ORF Transcript_39153/g.92461 Transcript_39153/m.92461 type:complete len:374 (+) Transcript_39153:197-1318(+)
MKQHIRIPTGIDMPSASTSGAGPSGGSGTGISRTSSEVVQNGPGHARLAGEVNHPLAHVQFRPVAPLHIPCPEQIVSSAQKCSHWRPNHCTRQEHMEDPHVPRPEQSLSRPVLGIPSHPEHVKLSPPHTAQWSFTLVLRGTPSHPVTTWIAEKCDMCDVDAMIFLSILSVAVSDTTPLGRHSHSPSSRYIVIAAYPCPVNALTVSLTFVSNGTWSWIGFGSGSENGNDAFDPSGRTCAVTIGPSAPPAGFAEATHWISIISADAGSGADPWRAAGLKSVGGKIAKAPPGVSSDVSVNPVVATRAVSMKKPPPSSSVASSPSAAPATLCDDTAATPASTSRVRSRASESRGVMPAASSRREDGDPAPAETAWRS